MRVKILRSTVASGRDLSAGEVYDLPSRDASILIRMGKAEPAGEEKRSSRRRSTKK